MTDHLLTEAQRRTYDALRNITVDGWPASVREVMQEAGLASPDTAHKHLHALRKLGYARQHPRNERGGWMAAS